MNQRERIINALLENGVVVDPDVLEHIMKHGGLSYLPDFLRRYRSHGFVSGELINDDESGYEQVNIKIEKPVEKSDIRKPEAYEHDWDIQLFIDPKAFTPVNGTVDDFKNLFQDRFRRLTRFLRMRIQLHNATDIKYLENGKVSVIGMVSDWKITSNGNLMFTLEDMTGQVKCFYNDEGVVLNDEIIGVVGTYSDERNMIYVDEIIRPGILPVNHDRRIREPISVAIISDVHIGSKTFLRKRWEKFIAWLKGGKDGAESIKYLIIGGDLVDGIGVYPNQERELEITDIFKQYEALAKYINDLPDYIKVIMIPGNHDIVRIAEPQPPLPEEIEKMFNGNVMLLSNPAALSIHGYKFLIYHGASLNNIVELVPGMSYEKINDAMKLLLEMRHLSPIYGEKVPLAPLHRDFLVIDTRPDVFITGHVHTFSYQKYKGVHLVNASTWQAQTLYQKMMNFKPDPGKVAVLELHTDSMLHYNF